MTEPSCPFKVKAKANYTRRNETEVNLVNQTIYNVYQTDGKGIWWQTKTDDGSVGWFPASYVDVVVEEQAPPPPPPPSTVSTPVSIPQPQPTVNTTTVTTQSVSPKTSSRETASPGRRGKPEKSNSKRGDDSKRKKKKKKKGSEKKETVPQPSKPPKVEENPGSAFLLIQVVECRNMKTVGGDTTKCNPGLCIFRKQVLDFEGKGDVIFKTAVLKKTNAPNWNERFQLNVHDAEAELIVLRFASGGKKGLKGKTFMGEITFPLRSSVRDFDRPNPQYKWYPITFENENYGEAKIYIEFVDTKEVGKPKDFQQVSHIGWSADGGFDISNIPPEWKRIFKSVGIRKKDLESNPELAGDVLKIMNQAAEDAGGAELDLNAPPPKKKHKETSQQSNSNVPTAPQLANNIPAPPPPPPAPKLASNAPPPPPPPGGNAPGPSGLTPPAPSNNNGAGPVSLLDQIRLGTGLKKVEVSDSPPPPPSSGSLADTLAAALSNHRGAITGDDASSGDDWSSTE